MKKTNNKGFSLVELIVVIAIMAVLIGVLAPTFTKYVEQSRRSTDIQNAEQIKAAITVAMATGETGFTSALNAVDASTLTIPNISSVPDVQGNVVASGKFTVTSNPTDGSCKVMVGAYDLTDPAQAKTYKDYVAP